MPDRARRPPPAPSSTPRSEDYAVYEAVPLPVTAMPRNQPGGAYNEPHSHGRGQLLYASSGLMRAATEQGLWFLPPGRALWIPAGVVHDQLMLGPVQMRSIYIDADLAARFGDRCRVVEVSKLLRELILALIAEPIEYVLEGRNQHIVGLILCELEHARSFALDLPWPKDRRLVAVCEAILAAPEQSQTVEYWADQVGASARTLIRLFIKETGLTYRQWVQQVRLTEALSRLEQGEAVGRIASQLGYASASAFSAMFRTVLGETPSEYVARKASN